MQALCRQSSSPWAWGPFRCPCRYLEGGGGLRRPHAPPGISAYGADARAQGLTRPLKERQELYFPSWELRNVKGGVFQGMFSPRKPEKPYKALKILQSLGSEVFRL